jgi:hypothetical protein
MLEVQAASPVQMDRWDLAIAPLVCVVAPALLFKFDVRIHQLRKCLGMFVAP